MAVPLGLLTQFNVFSVQSHGDLGHIDFQGSVLHYFHLRNFNTGSHAGTADLNNFSFTGFHVIGDFQNNSNYLFNHYFFSAIEQLKQFSKDKTHGATKVCHAKNSKNTSKMQST